jgi:hypothetical protein
MAKTNLVLGALLLASAAWNVKQAVAHRTTEVQRQAAQQAEAIAVSEKDFRDSVEIVRGLALSANETAKYLKFLREAFKETCSVQGRGSMFDVIEENMAHEQARYEKLFATFKAQPMYKLQ